MAISAQLRYRFDNQCQDRENGLMCLLVDNRTCPYNDSGISSQHFKWTHCRICIPAPSLITIVSPEAAILHRLVNSKQQNNCLRVTLHKDRKCTAVSCRLTSQMSSSDEPLASEQSPRVLPGSSARPEILRLRAPRFLQFANQDVRFSVARCECALKWKAGYGIHLGG